jgi:hypothetical protein
VYTFGNAASHFNNPLRKVSQSPISIDARDVESNKQEDTSISSSPTVNGSTTDELNGEETTKKPPMISEMLPERVVPHIEHYCNSQDMVTRWGALYSAKSILQNRFCGHIFINEGASGHMLNQHYLSDMFPLYNRRAGACHALNTSSDSKHNGVPFLDRIVNVDTATVTQRKSNLVHQLAVMRHESAPLHPDDHSHAAHSSHVHDIHDICSRSEHEGLSLTLGEGKKLQSQDLSGAEGSRISVVKVPHPEDKYVGKTVRQLSRLWRYLDGAVPAS